MLLLNLYAFLLCRDEWPFSVWFFVLHCLCFLLFCGFPPFPPFSQPSLSLLFVTVLNSFSFTSITFKAL